jgi:hypothetical protein
VELQAAQLEVEADFSDGSITRLDAEPWRPSLGNLIGRLAYSRFREALNDALPTERAAGTVLYQILDDLPITLLLSGRVLRAAGIGLPRRDPSRPLPVDICAGWVSGGTLLTGLTDFGPPLQTGPVVPKEPGIDPIGWHPLGPLGADATRRCRRTDVWNAGGVGQVDAFFRDSHAGADGVETVVHEYSLRASVDLRTKRVVSCKATPGPLPYPECPAAAASASQLRDSPVRGLRRTVGATLVGPSSCTHLNDALRSLEDVNSLFHSLLSPPTTTPDAP